MRESWQIFVAQIRSWHAPLGRYSPFAASALFAASAFSHSIALRVLAYGVATILALFIAVDLAHSLLERESPAAERERSRRLRYIPLNWFQFALAAALAAIYTWFIFVGLGPWTPFVFAALLYPLCYLVAWRNVRLWYQQGADYEEVLKEEAELERVRASHARMRNSDRDRARVLP